MAAKARTAEGEIARIASRQHGVVTRAQLLAAGLTRSEIAHRLKQGLLLRVHRGVYRAGHRAPSVEATYLAAVLACGDGAALSGPAAAYLLGLLKGKPPAPEVTAPGQHRIPGVRVRRARRAAAERTAVRGIPATTVPRTLVDLASVLANEDLARACHEAGVRYRTTPRQVEAILRRRPSAPGAAKLRSVTSGKEPAVLSRLEKAFLSLLRRADLPLPVTNRPAGGHRVDCRWPERKLTVELDSYRFHNSRHAWERDRARERAARARGDEHLRYTWGDVFERVGATERELRGLLAPG